MAVWAVRAGRNGEREAEDLSDSVIAIGWAAVSDLNTIASREALEDICREAYPDKSTYTIGSWVGQLRAFKEKIQIGDLIVLPLRSHAIAVGRITGPYQYRTDVADDMRHARQVTWIKTEMPRTSFPQDLLYSFGALGTVRQVRRENAQQLVENVLAGHADQVIGEEGQEETAESNVNLVEYSRNEIVKYIGTNFKGHALARLVGYILTAARYIIQVSPPGPDGGVDILAGQGSLGFGSPRLCVQVKSSNSPVDVGVLRELQGVMRNFGATQGVLVSWGGFKASVSNEARRHYFDIRLWDASNLVDELLERYESLPTEARAELPLRRIWALVRPDED